MRLLFVSPIAPVPKNLGAALRVNSFFSALCKLGDVHSVFLSNSPELQDKDTRQKYRVVRVLPRPTPELPGLKFVGSRSFRTSDVEWYVSYLPGYSRLYRSEALVREFRRTCSRDYDVAVFMRLSALWWTDWKRDLPSVVDLDDVLHLGIAGSIRRDDSVLGKMIKIAHKKVVQREELRSLGRVDAGTVCSELDARSIDSNRVFVVPNVYPVTDSDADTVRAGDDNVILFVGSIVYQPNREGLEYFVYRVFPRIRRQRRSVRLVIVGRSDPDSTFSWQSEEGVEFVGTVEDVSPYIREAGIEIAPLLSGMGTRIKILEALAHGRPVVATSRGAYGIDVAESDGLFRADDDDRFAEVCLQLLGDSTRRVALGKAAREIVKSRYSSDVAAKSLRAVVGRVTGRLG